MLAESSEFENMAVREDELPELDALARDCPYDVRGGAENKQGKINILLQAYIARARMESFSLTADMMYVSQNAPRICRALFEICLRRSWSTVAELALMLCKARCYLQGGVHVDSAWSGSPMLKAARGACRRLSGACGSTSTRCASLSTCCRLSCCLSWRTAAWTWSACR